MEWRVFPLKKLLILFTACLLALTGCTGGDAQTPSPEMAESVSPTPLASETTAPVFTSSPPAPSHTPEDSPPFAEPTPTSTPAPAGWNGDPDTLTLDDFPTQLSSGEDVAADVGALEAGSAGLYLVAQLPDDDTWLYGYCGPDDDQGLILRVGTQWQGMAIPFLTPQCLLPTMSYGDYDRDGEPELAVIVFVGGGTGTDIWGLSVVDFSGGVWELLQFEPTDYAAIVELSLSSTYVPETDTLVLLAGDASVALDLAELGYADLGEELEASLGSWVSFSTGADTISASFGITLWAPGMPAEGVRAATLNANVVYTGSAFGLGDFSFASSQT